MTSEPDDDTDSSDPLITTRGILKGIGGVGVGLGLGGAGVLAIADQSEHVDRAAVLGPEKPDKTPSQSRPTESGPEETLDPRTTPWNKENLVVSIERNDSLQRFNHPYTELDKAVEFWNDYIEANVQFDLTLSFERGHSNPDILFTQVSMMDACFGEYDSPATNDEYLAPLVCVETLRETPSETPVTATIGTCVHGRALYGLIAKHTIGRLIGFDIWTDPVDVMTPEILFGPAHADQPDARALMGTPSGGSDAIKEISEKAETAISSLQNSGNPADTLQTKVSDINGFVDTFESEMSQWKPEAKGFGFPEYVEAYEETVENDEMAYLKETTAMMTELAENTTIEKREDVKAVRESEEFQAIIDRLEHVTTWASEREMWDVQIHRAFTRTVWSEWTSE